MSAKSRILILVSLVLIMSFFNPAVLLAQFEPGTPPQESSGSEGIKLPGLRTIPLLLDPKGFFENIFGFIKRQSLPKLDSPDIKADTGGALDRDIPKLNGGVDLVGILKNLARTILGFLDYSIQAARGLLK